MELSKRYNAKGVEKKWYDYWMEKDYFRSTPDAREPYTIVIPPPNVTGVLHMGHMLNHTVQDVLIRKARKENKNALWVPGSDHASIATEAKVVKWLREEKKLTKGDLTREQFLEYAWQWTDKYGGIILEQLKQLGASCDWTRTAFTLDEARSRMVTQAFVDLYNNGLLYRGQRMVNWDPAAKTVLSNEEVLYGEETSKLYYVKYPISDGEGFVTIATTRPETIMGDTGVAVHPEDRRYTHLQGKRVEIPLTGRTVPLIFDDYIDKEFGTGALKVTPAHDVNDYEIGQRHDLDTIDVFNDDGTISEAAGILTGMDRFDARQEVVRLLVGEGLLEKTEDHVHNVGRSERTNVVVEPRLSLQWYVKTNSLAAPALHAVETDEIQFFPPHMKNTYRHWMENIRDWCISRQLWWGHQIPAWYWQEHVIVAIDEEDALQKAKLLPGGKDLTIEDLTRDEDVLDTWFSSWLWPISVFGNFENQEIQYYYPTTVLVTGWDIIFLWVARMIMAGYQWKDNKPFSSVYFTGMVRDKKGRKMSKSLGNSPDAIKLIEQYGADGVRFGMLSCSPAGGDLLFDEKLCEQGRNFCNKMWNALRLLSSWSENADADLEPGSGEKAASRWFEYKLYQTVEKFERDFEQYRLSEALISAYSLIWNDYCSWYLEMIKPAGGIGLSKEIYLQSCKYFESLMSLLHPFMPFVTEEITARLGELQKEELLDCIISPPPINHGYDEDILQKMESLRELVTNVRELRNKFQIKQGQPLELYFHKATMGEVFYIDPGYSELLSKMAGLTKYTSTDDAPAGSATFMSRTGKYYLPVSSQIDPSEEIAKLENELDHATKFLSGVEKKLSNKKFVNNAPPKIVEKENQKRVDGRKKIEQIKESLVRFQKMVEG